MIHVEGFSFWCWNFLYSETGAVRDESMCCSPPLSLYRCRGSCLVVYQGQGMMSR